MDKTPRWRPSLVCHITRPPRQATLASLTRESRCHSCLEDYKVLDSIAEALKDNRAKATHDV